MDHSLGALLEQNDQEHEQAIYNLSRTMVGLNIVTTQSKRVSSSSLRHSEDATLSYKPAHSCHLQSQFSAITHDKTLIGKLSIIEMGYIALVIRDAI